MTFFEKVRVLVFAHLNRARCPFLEFLYIVEGGPLINVLQRVYFALFYGLYLGFYRHYRGAERVIISFRGFRRIPTELVGEGDNIIPRIPSDSDGIGRSG